jgi:predicted nucleic acid-binding protein
LIVLDSSVLIGFFRGHQSPAITRFKDLEREDVPFLLPALCYQEVLQGARDEKEWKLLDEYLGSQDLLVPQNPVSTHQAAARIYFDCRRKGLTIRSSADCFLAQLVLEADGTLLHDDGDFESIAKVRPIKTLRG